MKPVSVHIDVPQAPEDVFDYLDVMANHETFTNHYMTNWSCSGPDRGVGSKAHVTAKLGGQAAEVDIEVVDAEAPLADRVAAPLVRSMMRKANEKAMERLAGELSSAAVA
jgi:hypothetical protein